MELISLGSNCSVTYQLDVFALRTHAYPFDWAKISLTQLIDVLSNNFIDYAESIKFKKESESHPLIGSNSKNENKSSSIIISNKYGITFAHELGFKYEVEEFKKKIISRIERFVDLKLNTNKVIRFVRIELNPIKSNWKSQITRLISLLDVIIGYYELVLIINSQEIFEFPPNILIYKYDKFDPDWKMDMLNWNYIFTN